MIRFNAIGKSGIEEEWSGLFKTNEESEKWYEKYGKKHEASGVVLIKYVCGKNGKINTKVKA